MTHDNRGKRQDTDGELYSFAEFEEYYGADEADARWRAAAAGSAQKSNRNRKRKNPATAASSSNGATATAASTDTLRRKLLRTIAKHKLDAVHVRPAATGGPWTPKNAQFAGLHFVPRMSLRAFDGVAPETAATLPPPLLPPSVAAASGSEPPTDTTTQLPLSGGAVPDLHALVAEALMELVRRGAFKPSVIAKPPHESALERRQQKQLRRVYPLRLLVGRQGLTHGSTGHRQFAADWEPSTATTNTVAAAASGPAVVAAAATTTVLESAAAADELQRGTGTSVATFSYSELFAVFDRLRQALEQNALSAAAAAAAAARGTKAASPTKTSSASATTTRGGSCGDGGGGDGDVGPPCNEVLINYYPGNGCLDALPTDRYCGLPHCVMAWHRDKGLVPRSNVLVYSCQPPPPPPPPRVLATMDAEALQAAGPPAVAVAATAPGATIPTAATAAGGSVLAGGSGWSAATAEKSPPAAPAGEGEREGDGQGHGQRQGQGEDEGGGEGEDNGEDDGEGEDDDEAAVLAPWRVAFKISWDAKTPALCLPVSDGDAYFMLGGFNDTHQHAVLAGAGCVVSLPPCVARMTGCAFMRAWPRATVIATDLLRFD
jgi:hypothetical protein